MKVVPLLRTVYHKYRALRAGKPITESPAQRQARMAWFREARFGMFIHWGLYAVAAGEWNDKPIDNGGEWIQEFAQIPNSQYEQLLPRFNPTRYDPRTWVALAKQAGMKYIVFTTKHHDGFCLWDSKLTDWDVMSSPFKRDVLKELAAACHEAGLRLGLYHSLMDCHHPDWGSRHVWYDRSQSKPRMDRYVAYLKGQLRELLSGYGPICLLWFDGEWESAWTHWRAVDLYNFMRRLQPNLIINNRIGKARAGFSGMDQGDERVGDYGTPEQEIPATGFGPDVIWESCMTMNATWGYKKNDHTWKSTRQLVHNLIDCASKGGNYLLNVGPTGEGEIPQPSVERLTEIGRWMRGNGAAIYGTAASPFAKLPFEGRCTVHDAKLFLHVFTWPSDGLQLTGLKTPVHSARVLASGQMLDLRQQGKPGGEPVLQIARPNELDPLATVIELDLAGPPEVANP